MKIETLYVIIDTFVLELEYIIAAHNYISIHFYSLLKLIVHQMHAVKTKSILRVVLLHVKIMLTLHLKLKLFKTFLNLCKVLK